MKLYLDDERPTPDGWQNVRTVEDAIELLKTGKVEEISLDNDLGIGYTQGWELAYWIREEAFKGTLKRVKWHVHTGSMEFALKIRLILDDADKFWDYHEKRKSREEKR